MPINLQVIKPILVWLTKYQQQLCRYKHIIALRTQSEEASEEVVGHILGFSKKGCEGFASYNMSFLGKERFCLHT